MAHEAPHFTYAERRRRPRTSVRCISHAAQSNAETGEHVESMGVTANISAGGMRLLTLAPFDRDRELEVAFALGETIVEARGRIVRMDDKRDGQVDIGVEFQDLGEEGRQLIEDYCRRLKRAIGRKLRAVVARRQRGPVALRAGRN